MNVLVLGGGGREHALCWSLSRSRRLKNLYALPGNAGTAELAVNLPGDPCDPKVVLEHIRRERIELTVVGPEDPLAAGLVDALEHADCRVFGPTAEAARVESDKAFAKQIMRQHAIPTAEARIFDDYSAAREYIATRDAPLVVKAAGLARGKGVIMCDDPPTALRAAEQILVDQIFGDAGRRIVVEERLEGREASVLALVDGRTIYLLEPAQDYKRLGAGDVGPNTGGMGSFCPSRAIDDDTMSQIERQVFVPLVDALVRRDVRYRGVLYAGLMLTTSGPKVLEFNCRFGDPETQVILPRLKSDLLETFDLACRGKLHDARLEWDSRPAVCVVMASQGYPDRYETGRRIHGLREAAQDEDVRVFHAGTRLASDGAVETAGGRVVGVTALDESLASAAERAYAAVEKIRFEGAVWRKDVGATGE